MHKSHLIVWHRITGLTETSNRWNGSVQFKGTCVQTETSNKWNGSVQYKGTCVQTEKSNRWNRLVQYKGTCVQYFRFDIILHGNINLIMLSGCYTWFPNYVLVSVTRLIKRYPFQYIKKEINKYTHSIFTISTY